MIRGQIPVVISKTEYRQKTILSHTGGKKMRNIQLIQISVSNSNLVINDDTNGSLRFAFDTIKQEKRRFTNSRSNFEKDTISS